jgi:2-oxoacid dehydrogenases acyltransferase (catalytic domain)
MSVSEHGPRSVPGGRTFRQTSQRRPGARDRVALSTWKRGSDARVSCTVRLEWDRVSTAHPNTVPVALVGFALAKAFAQNPAANRRVALWRIHTHKSVRLSFAVDGDDGLRIGVVDRANELTERAFQHALRVAARDAKEGVGPLTRATRLIEHLPVGIARPTLKAWSFLTAGLGFSLLGVSGAPFGVALISSVGRFGLPAADVPFVPFMRCAMVCSIGALTQSVVARDGNPVVVDCVDVFASFDHRICDAPQLAELMQTFEEVCYCAAPATNTEPSTIG